MKKIILKRIPIVLFALIATINVAIGQSYHSTPTALKNLEDEAAFVSHQLESELQPETDIYIATQEKLRFIETVLRVLEKEGSVRNVAEKYLPRDEINIIQPGVKHFDAGFANTIPNKYIRAELMSLISY